MKYIAYRIAAYVLDLLRVRHNFHRKAGAIVAARTRKQNRLTAQPQQAQP